MQKQASVTLVSPAMRKVLIVYYLSYGGGFLEHPHLLEVSISASSRGLCLKDVKKSLASLRGCMMLSSFSWSYKRSYKQAYVWQDLESDNDLIFPTHGGSEYILKGCKIDSSCAMQTSAYPASKSPGCSAFLQSVDKVSTPVDPLIVKMVELPSASEKAKRNTVKSSSRASLHVCEENLRASPGMIESLEHHHASQKSDPHHELHAQGQAFTSLDRIIHASEQGKVSNRKCVSQVSDIDTKFFLKGKTFPYGSKALRNCTKDDANAGTSFSSSHHVFVDAATQTIKDDELPIQHTRSKLACPTSKCFKRSRHEPFCPTVQAASSLTSTSREKIMYKQDSISQNLRREEIFVPPSVSSSATTTRLHSTASCNTVLSHKIDGPRPKISFHQSAHFSEDQMFRKAMIGLTHGNPNNDSPLSSSSLITSSILEDLDQESYTDPIDCSFQKSKLTSESTSMKSHHEISVFSSSGRFLRLMSCGGGLEVIRPMRTISDRSDRDHRDSFEEFMSGAEIPFNDAKYGSPCMHASLLKAENNVIALGSSPPYVARDVLLRGYLSEVEVPTQVSTQEAKSSNKKMWHFKGWVNSHYKMMKKSIKGSSTSFVSRDDSYACSKGMNIETRA